MKFNFKLFSSSSLSAKVANRVIVLTAVMFALMLIYVFISFKNNIDNDSFAHVESKSKEAASYFENYFASAIKTASAMEKAVLALKKETNPNRETVLELCKKVLETNKNFYSVWVVYEPNAFDNADTAYTSGYEHSNSIGRFAPGYNRKGNEIVMSASTSEDEVSKSDYYVLPKKTLKATLLDPDYYSYTGKVEDNVLITTVAIPLLYNGSFIGVVGIDISLESLNEYNNKIKLYETGFGKLLSQDGVVITHPDRSQIMKKSSDIKDDENSEKILNSIRKGEILSMFDFSFQLQKNTLKVFAPVNFDGIETKWSYAPVVPIDEILSELNKSFISLIFISIIVLFIMAFVISYTIKKLIKPVKNYTERIKILAQGKIKGIEAEKIVGKDEIAVMVGETNKLLGGLKQTAAFAKEIGSGNLDANFEPLSDEDELGNALLEMRDSLNRAKEEEAKRKIEDNQRNWTTEGLAKFADIMRQNNKNLNEFGYNIISNLIKYLKANQGGFFVYNDEDKNQHPHLELLAAYAYERRKALELKVDLGDGLVGACAFEKQTILLTDVPDEYIKIKSGLGGSNPRCLILVPLKLEDDIFGVIEIASFYNIEKYQIEFLEKLADSIASTLAAVKINMRTEILLKQSQQQGELMQQQEEEMRQNLEELQATQEEMERKASELKEKEAEAKLIREKEMEDLRAELELQRVKAERDLKRKLKEQEEQLNQQLEELKAAEEEMRQNLEEMNAIQEDLKIKSDELQTEKTRVEQLLAQHKNETDELRSEMEMLNVQMRRKDKQIAKITEEKTNLENQINNNNSQENKENTGN